jgi:hypothetical protein
MQNTNRKQQKKVPADVKQYVKAQLSQNVELRKLDQMGQFPVAPTSGTFALNLVPVASRDGEVVHSHRVRLAFTVEVGAGVSITQFLRCIVFRWKPLTKPTVADVLESTTAATIINSPHRFTTREFYTILSDQVLGLTPNSNLAAQTSVREYKDDRKLRFSDAAVPAVTVGVMYVAWVSDETTAAQPVLNYNARQTYTDA